ncbi:hypothetical protein BDV26DRAFT_266480 [Aspergillus bertholletiae]|uniref:Ipa protein n=1 Tax=Aspergillus bertholletiae TaxID=1226010 RepID=A0A5N7B3B4_9EURO|nr:hypothetical protein BDV26DRAFT_266480 [Aspergillus bertholletiae]
MEKPDLVKELQRDLARKYRLHGPKIEGIWHSLGKAQRERILRAGAAEGQMLKSPIDRSLGDVYKVIPDWNLRDITDPDSNYLLDCLKYRATKPLCEQYLEGVNGSPGDAAVILKSMQVHGLKHVEQFRYGLTLFMDEAQYGQSFTASDREKYKETMAMMKAGVDAGLIVPQSTGELILERQSILLSAMNVVIQDILEAGSTAGTKAHSKKSDKAAREAMSKLAIDQKPEKLSLEELAALSLDQKSALEDYVLLCRTEPEFLAHAVNAWFFSRPELVPDERGRRLPLVTDKYINIAFFEMIHNAVVGAAVWGYIHQLLQALVTGPNDRAYRSPFLQELANVCHFEYQRVQRLFKRSVQMTSGDKHFKRVSGVYDNGTARVTMKTKPDTLTRTDPQLHYILRLCQTDTTVSRAVEWVRKLDDLHQTHPAEREKMGESGFDAFGDLAVTTNFVQCLSTSLPMPPMNPKKGQTYISRLKALGSELDPLKSEVDLSEFAVPIENLMEPGMAQGALTTLDEFISNNTGAEIGFLYQDLNEECLSGLQNEAQQQKDKNEQIKQAELPSSIPEVSNRAVEIEQRKEKTKTRPAHSSVYSISPKAAPTTESEPASPPQPFKVKPSSLEVFSTLFSRQSQRSSITWAAFQTAMAHMKFSAVPKTGSIYTFSPPEGFNVQKSITFHRPHQSRIEGCRLLSFASRLKRKYGWDEKSFQTE